MFKRVLLISALGVAAAGAAAQDAASEKELARPKSGAGPKRLLIVDVPSPVP